MTMENYYETYILLLTAGDRNFIKFSEWTTGELCWTERKATPYLCTVFLSRYENIPADVREYFDNNKRVKGVIAFTGTAEQKQNILNHFNSL